VTENYGPPIRFSLVAIALVAGGLACNLSTSSPTETPAGQAETAIAGTVAAHITESAVPDITEVATVGPADTSIPEQSPSPPPGLATATISAPSIPMVSVSINTNCRTGPGISYDLRGALLVGETEEIVAISTAPNYWYITNPDRPGEFCYLWGEYATVVGETQALPKFTPLPSPTPTNTPTPSVTPTPSNTPTPTYTPSPTP
jgi:hypothetical protein